MTNLSELARWRNGLVRRAATSGDLLLVLAEAVGDEANEVSAWPSTSAGAGDGRGAGTDPAGDRIAAAFGEKSCTLAFDHVSTQLLAAFVALEAAEQLARAALGRRRRRGQTDEQEAERAPGCVNCSRFEIYTPLVRGGRCQECWDFRIANDLRDTPEWMVRARPGNATRRQLARRAAIPAESARLMAERIDQLRRA